MHHEVVLKSSSLSPLAQLWTAKERIDELDRRKEEREQRERRRHETPDIRGGESIRSERRTHEHHEDVDISHSRRRHIRDAKEVVYYSRERKMEVPVGPPKPVRSIASFASESFAHLLPYLT